MITKFKYRKVEFKLFDVKIEQSIYLGRSYERTSLKKKICLYKSNQYISFIECEYSNVLESKYNAYTTNNYYLIIGINSGFKPHSFFRIYKDEKIIIDKAINNSLNLSFGNSAEESLKNLIDKLKGRELFR